MTETTANDSGPRAYIPDSSIFTPKHITRLLVAVMTVISCIVFICVGNWIHWPGERRFQGSMTLPFSFAAIAAALIGLVICTVIGTTIVGRRFFLGGLMTAAAGLSVWAARGGTITYVLFSAENAGIGNHIFLRLLGELVVMFAVIGVMWDILWTNSSRPGEIAKHDRSDRITLGEALEKQAYRSFLGIFGRILWVRKQANKPAKTQADAPSRSSGAAIVAQMTLMAILMMLFAATPQKKQVLAGLFFAGLISTAFAEYFFANHTAARWYWVAPLVVGAFGYLAAYLTSAGTVATGDLNGTFGQLARGLPLDYASLGTAGVLVGYWWMMPSTDDTTVEEAKPAAGD